MNLSFSHFTRKTSQKLRVCII